MEAALISPEYKALLVEQHTSHPNWGKGMAGKPYRYKYLLNLAADWDVKTLLDWGCGKGRIKHILGEKAPWITVSEYDPGIPGKDTIPVAQYDMVWCTHVLEHVEPEYLDAVLTCISRRAERAFFIIPSKKAGEILLDGRNAHLIQQSPHWWEEKLLEHYALVEKSFEAPKHMYTGHFQCYRSRPGGVC